MQAFRLPCFQEFWDRVGPNFLDPRFRAFRISDSQAACRPWELTHGRNGSRLCKNWHVSRVASVLELFATSISIHLRLC